KQIQFILVPHEVSNENIQQFIQYLPDAHVYSSLLKNKVSFNNPILILDVVGLLNKVYRFGNINYIGGGFNSAGIHNILEAIIYEKIVLFGPNYSKYKEAVDIVQQKGAYCIKNDVEIENIITLVKNKDVEIQDTIIKSQQFIQQNIGSTTFIMQKLKTDLYL
ncbi:MAG: hypothetical protein ORN58_01365, partial [Sediminibacterium sp.]|nr:hypothetical protein [Sediminibacterium sp.]